DKSFDGDGEKVIQLHAISEVNDIAIQADGKLVLVGSSDVSGLFGGPDDDFAIVRLNPSGSLDSTFDGDGKRTFGLDGFDQAHAVAFGAGGTIVMFGESRPTGNAPFSFAVARLKSNGSFDTTFSNDGKVNIAFTGRFFAFGEGVMVQPDNKIVAVG